MEGTPTRDLLATRRFSSSSLSATTRRLPKPKTPSKCPLLCCFYAEFDIKEGPKLCYDSPRGFMQQDVSGSVNEMERMLAQGFQHSTSSDSFENNTTPITTTRKQSDASIPELSTTEESDNDPSQRSIFTACGEYIIPSSGELTGNIISLSTHSIHVLTRPTIISNEKYERNSLLFSVGLILRRTEDPRPFQPVLSKIALTLQAMEIENEYLSSQRGRNELQSFLDGVLVSLNGDECNLLLQEDTSPVYVSLKLFRPPRVVGTADSLVHNFHVPILLRRDWQQSSDWDLAILWVSRHIDGVSNAQQISTLAEVDMEMVRACLQVLKHHNVIALVDMFFYSNRYECTSIQPSSALLLEAVGIVYKQPGKQRGTTTTSTNGSHNNTTATKPYDSSPELAPQYQLTGTPPYGSFTQQMRQRHASEGSNSFPRSYHQQHHPEQPNNAILSHLKPEQIQIVQEAIAEFFCACHRGITVGDLWMDLVTQRLGQQRLPWKKMFRRIDHRRLTTFGVVHGLLRRVHSFPMLVDRGGDDVVCPPQTNNKCYHRNDDTPQRDGHGGSGGGVSMAKLRRREERRQLIERAAALMDGSRCDDDLVSSLNLPLTELFALFAQGRIVEVLST